MASRCGIDDPKRVHFSKRGYSTVVGKCVFCGHDKLLVGGGVTKCARCRKKLVGGKRR